MISTEHVIKSNDDVKDLHLKKLEELSKPEPGELDFKVDGSVWRNGKILLEEPTYEQKAWVIRRMRGSARSWEVWDQ